MKINLGHAHKTRFWYPFRGVLEIFRRAPRHFYRSLPPPPPHPGLEASNPVLCIAKERGFPLMMNSNGSNAMNGA